MAGGPRLRLFHQRSLSPVQGPALNPFSNTLWKHRKPPDLWSCVPRTGFGLTHLEVGASSKNEGRYFLLPRLNQRRIQACRYTNKKRATYIPTYTCSIVLTAIPLTEAMLASRIVPVTPAPTSLPMPSSQALITAWGVHNKRMASEEWGKLSDAVQLSETRATVTCGLYATPLPAVYSETGTKTAPVSSIAQGQLRRHWTTYIHP